MVIGIWTDVLRQLRDTDWVRHGQRRLSWSKSEKDEQGWS